MTTVQQPSVTATPGSDPFRQLACSSGLDFFASLPGTPEHEKNRKQWVERLSRFLQTGNDSSPAQKGSALLFLKEIADEFSFTVLPPRQGFCQEITRDQKSVLVYYWGVALELCEELIRRSVKRKTHQKRRHSLDQVIKRLLRLEKEITGKQFPDEDRVKLALARAYYLRGKIIRPKGFTVSAKKIETLEYAEGTLAELVNNDTTGEARLLRAMVHIDLAALREGDGQKRKPDNYLEVLATAVSVFSSSTGANKTEEIERIHIILARAEDDPDWANNDGRNLLQGILNNSQTPVLLQKARASLLLNDTDTAIRNALAAIATMTNKALPFSHEDWRLLVLLLRELRNRSAQGSDDLILEAWEEVSRLERRTNGGMHVRWYWSRQRDLYDLAFHAAGDKYEIKAKIADSLKARPALHLTQAADLDLAVERMEMGLLDRYITNLENPLPASEDKSANDTDLASWPELPKPWIAVHFYLSNGFGQPEGKKQGYVLILDSITGEWQEQPFDYRPIWSAYMTWQENYQAMREKAAPDLERLCRAMGREMAFLFESSLFPQERPVVFVPHEFLHRLPLHAAIMEQNGKTTLFAAGHPSSSLPAWWMRQGGSSPPPQPEGNPLLLIFWPGWGTGPGSSNHKQLDALPSANMKNPAGSQDLLDLARPPSQLALFCHGNANWANPFASWLTLTDNKATLAAILRTKKNLLAGSEVILSACETDLMPPVASPLDEHLTLSGALLQKGATAIVGSLWEIDPVEGDELALDLLQTAMKYHETVRQRSGARLAQFLTTKDCRQLYDGAAFRVIGITN